MNRTKESPASRPSKSNFMGNSLPKVYSKPGKKAPPYSAHCRDLLKHPNLIWGRSPDGLHVTVTVGIGSECWTWAAKWPYRPLAILPDGESPSRYDWAFCKASDPVLIESAGLVELQRVHELAHEIIAATGNRVIHRGGARYLPQEAAA